MRDRLREAETCSARRRINGRTIGWMQAETTGHEMMAELKAPKLAEP
jgi:hypothetical protein